MNIQGILQKTAMAFKRCGIPSARLDAEVLLSCCLKTQRLTLYKYPGRILTDDELCRFQKLVERRRKGEPVAYIIGQKEFWSLCLKVDEHVLIPRPETECLVEEVLNTFAASFRHNLRILDVGTGSGAISIALASEIKDVRIEATDISAAALAIARENAGNNGVHESIVFHCGNMFEPVSGKFDAIVSNPPYISDEEFTHLSDGVRLYEPKEALMAGPRGTKYFSILIHEGAPFLKEDGWLFMEIGAAQRKNIEAMLIESDLYDSISFKRDYAGIDRIAKARRKTTHG
jgi:release factor glutamine methyltransferase